MSDDLTVIGPDDIRRSYDEHYDTMMDVEQDPTGAWQAIQKQADRIEELEAENHLLKTSGIVEVAVRNPNVSEYIRHWEGRAETAEAKLAKAVDVLGYYARNDDGGSIARTALAELTGGKDE